MTEVPDDLLPAVFRIVQVFHGVRHVGFAAQLPRLAAKRLHFSKLRFLSVQSKAAIILPSWRRGVLGINTYKVLKILLGTY